MTAPTTSASGLAKRDLYQLLGALIAAVLLASLDTSILVTALPTISGQFNAFEQLSWVITAYIVTSTISTPLLGKLSDLYGRRLVFQIAMGTFAVASLLCGLSQSIWQLVAARAFQGVGGGAIQALAFAIIGDVLSPRERGRYIGYFTMAFAASALLGPLVGGFIIERWSWPWIFFINLPLCVAVMIITNRVLRLPLARRSGRLDWPGAVLLSAGLGSFMIGLERGRNSLTNPTSMALVGIGVVVLGLFVMQERRADEPMIPPRLFRNKVVLASCMLGICLGASSFGASNFLSVYFQDALFVSPTNSGLRTLPLMIGVVLSSTLTGRFIAKSGRYKRFPVAGSLLATVGLFALALTVLRTSPYPLLVPCLFAMGVGLGASYTTSSIATQNACDMRDIGIATATVMFFRNLGGAMMTAVSGTILNRTIRAELPSRTGLSADAAVKLIREPAQIKALPIPARDAVVSAISGGVGRIQLVAGCLLFIGFLWAVAMPELPLRSSSSFADRALGEPD